MIDEYNVSYTYIVVIPFNPCPTTCTRTILALPYMTLNSVFILRLEPYIKTCQQKSRSNIPYLHCKTIVE